MPGCLGLARFTPFQGHTQSKDAGADAEASGVEASASELYIDGCGTMAEHAAGKGFERGADGAREYAGADGSRIIAARLSPVISPSLAAQPRLMQSRRMNAEAGTPAIETSLEWLLEQSLFVEGKVSNLAGIGIDVTDDHMIHEVDIENPCGFLQATDDANVRIRGGRVP
ncbi:hypothetical protein OH491_22385 [Termitidicoccus mucosus]